MRLIILVVILCTAINILVSDQYTRGIRKGSVQYNRQEIYRLAITAVIRQ